MELSLLQRDLPLYRRSLICLGYRRADEGFVRSNGRHYPRFHALLYTCEDEGAALALHVDSERHSPYYSGSAINLELSMILGAARMLSRNHVRNKAIHNRIRSDERPKTQRYRRDRKHPSVEDFDLDDLPIAV